MKKTYTNIETILKFPSLVTLVLLLAPALASASHFRGGSITWQSANLDADGQQNDVVITVKTAWRRDSINPVYSLGSSPALAITQVEESHIFVGGTDATNSDYALQTTILEAHNLDPNTHYRVNFSGGNRIYELLNNSNGYWNIQSTIYMAGNNLAPKIDLPIIFQVPQFESDGTTALANWTFDIGSTDPNADKLRYRLANIDELGNYGQTNPPGLSINPNTGLLTWTGSGSMTAGLYSGGIVAEDVDPSGNPKSKSHVDFILDLQPTAAIGFTPSAGIPETHNVRVEKGTTYSFSINGAAIETQSLGDIQGALTEPTEGDFVFEPGPLGSGLDPGTYPITFEIFDTTGTYSNGYLTLNFIVPDPNAPRIENLEGDRTVYAATAAQLIDESVDALVSDADNPHLNGGRLKFNVTFTDGEFEVLGIESVGDGTGEIRVAGDQVFYEGNLIGTIDPVLDGVGKAIQIGFSTNDATLEAVEALIHSLTYEDTFILRASGDRALAVYIEDPEGHASSYDLFIDVQDHPSAPPAGGGPVEAANQLTIVEGATISLSAENVNYADPDAGDTVTITVASVTHGQFELVSNPGVAITSFTQEQVSLGQIAFAHDGTETAPTYELSASDGTNTPTEPSAGTITFANVADQAPVISGTPATSVLENTAYTFTPSASDADVGTGSDLAYSVSNRPAWASFDTATGELSGTPAGTDAGVYPNIVISVTDDGGLSDSLPSFSIEVLANPDDDGDGVPDTQEATDGTDPNDPADYLDTDVDGVPDYVEGTDGTDPNDADDSTDTDGDGVPDYVEEKVYGTDPGVADTADTDGDGVPDYEETYGDGTDPNDGDDFQDSDGDGVPDYVEADDGTDPDDPADATDTDGDGVPDYVEDNAGTDPADPADATDTDGDGTPDYVENRDGTDPADPADSADTDGDGVPDYIEEHENGTDPADPASYEDTDGDEVPDYVEDNDDTDPADPADVTDTDGDGTPDYVENRDGTDPADPADVTDTDGDGVPDYVEEHENGTDPADPASYEDTDGDQVPDYVEDNDGTDPADPADVADTDGDGTPDYVEDREGTDPNDSANVTDTDGDGVPDYVEGNDGTDPANPADATDSDADGVPDYVEDNAGTDPADPASVTDTDGDGTPDYVEDRDGTDSTDPEDSTDTDGDGVPDYVEEHEDGTDPDDPASYEDTDGDLVPDYVEDRDGSDPEDATDVTDTDGDGTPDYVEDRDGTDPTDPADVTDTDGDGTPDYVENRDGTDPADPADSTDTDGDGVPDYVEEHQDGTDPADPASYEDTDGDDVPDYVEDDEGTDPADPADVTDTDGDGTPDYVENRDGTDPSDPAGSTDTDGDGVPDYVEEHENGTDPTDPADVTDTDGDGTPDYVENGDGTDPTDPASVTDTDGDGVPDYVEDKDGTDSNDPSSAADTDGDGTPDYIEDKDGTDPTDPADVTDTDGDGVPDYVEEQKDGTDPNDASDATDTDGDQVPDYVEDKQGTDPDDAGDYRDTDGDQVPDHVEAANGTDPEDPADVTDTDGDGVPDYVETETDGTDPNDASDRRDTDGDGTPDYVETETEGTDPADADDFRDTDGDGVPDYVEEHVYGTDPQTRDTGDADGDGVPDYTETYVEGTDPADATDYVDTDADSVPDYVENQVDGTNGSNANDYVDSDNDGVPDYLENVNGTDPNASGDFRDSDGDGVPDFTEEQAGTDPNDATDAPVAMVTVDAAGRFTKVTRARLVELGLIASADGADCCGNYKLSDADGEPLFAPGRNRIAWDGAGTNVLLVRPQVSLGPDKAVTEGEIAQFKLYLNGLSPEYPLVVPYTISGTATPTSDHDLLAEGAAVFANGETEATVTFLVADDGAAEGEETIVVALDDPGLNLGSRSTQTLRIVEGNLPAAVELDVVQAGRSGLTVSQAEGPVVATATVTDPNVDDTHGYDWSGTSGELEDGDAVAQTFTFDPATVVEGTYELTLDVGDDGDPAATTTVSVRIRVVASLPVLGAADSDGDGSSDADEGFGDTDGDGVPDWLDRYDAPSVLQESASEPRSYLIECDPGTSCKLGAYAMTGATGGSLLAAAGEPLPQGMSGDIDYDNVGGVFDAETSTVLAGQSVRVVVPQRDGVPMNASFRVYVDGGWVDFAEDDANGVRSAPGEAGVCPPPGDAGYTPGLTPGDMCVQVLIEDGGANDADGAANGKAALLGGVGEAVDVVYRTDGGTSGGGAAGPFLLLVLAAGALAGTRRREMPGRALGRGGLRPPHGSPARWCRSLLVALAAVLLVPARGAVAQEAGDAWWQSFYLSASFGSADTGVSADALEREFEAAGIESEISDVESDRTGWGAALGLPLGRGFAVEAGYRNLAQTEITFTALSTADGLAAVYPESGEGWTLSALYEHVLSERASVRLRAGAFDWENEFETLRLDTEVPVDVSTASGTDFYWGAGAWWRLSRGFSVGLEYQRFEFPRHPVGYAGLGLRWWPERD